VRQDETKEGGKHKCRLVACWPCLGDGGSLSSCSQCCKWDYIFESMKFYSLDYWSMRKGVTANIPMRNGHARVVLWRRRIGQFVGRVGW
jgi:hypothetical protein